MPSRSSLFVQHLRPEARGYADLPGLEEVLASLPARELTVLRLRLSSGELHSLMGAVRSQLDLSLSSLLRDPGPPPSSGTS